MGGTKRRLCAAVVLTGMLTASTYAWAVAQVTPTPAAATEELELVFRLVDDPDLADLGKGSVWPVVEGDGVLVALNSCPEMQRKPACRRSILRSVDGLAWDIVGDPLPGPLRVRLDGGRFPDRP